MESIHRIMGDFNVEIEKCNRQYELKGLRCRELVLLEDWEDIVMFSVIANDFGYGKLKKNFHYTIGPITMYRRTLKNEEYLRIEFINSYGDLDAYDFQSTQVRALQTILNRIVWRCDVLNRKEDFSGSENDIEVSEESGWDDA